jgi:integrase
LLPLALDIIGSVTRMASRDRLFGTSAAEGFSGWSKAKAALDRRCGVAEWTVHDLRRSAATHMADIGVQPHVIEQILNHQSGHRAGVAGVYNRSPYEREVKQALSLWEDHINALVTGGERKVLSFPQHI